MISDGLYEWFEKYADKPCRHRSNEYMEFKEKLTRHLLDILYEFVPETKGRVEYHHLGTPLSEITYLTSFRAGSYGVSATCMCSFWKGYWLHYVEWIKFLG